MTHTIWKYELGIDEKQELEVPKGAQFLCLQLQHGNQQAWFIVDPDEPKKETRTILCVRTNGSLVHGGAMKSYLGTIQLHEGYIVLHYFEQLGTSRLEEDL